MSLAKPERQNRLARTYGGAMALGGHGGIATAALDGSGEAGDALRRGPKELIARHGNNVFCVLTDSSKLRLRPLPSLGSLGFCRGRW